VVKAFYLGTMDTGQKLEKVVKHRRSMFPIPCRTWFSAQTSRPRSRGIGFGRQVRSTACTGKSSRSQHGLP
jgi:hypothetical protein